MIYAKNQYNWCIFLKSLPMDTPFQSGAWKEQYWYRSFLPNLINRSFTWDDPRINILLEKANFELWKLESFSSFIPDIDFFVSMHVWKEAIKSSRIEWTKTKFDDLFLEENSEQTTEERDDHQEVRNYIQWLNHGISTLENLPLSFRLFNDIHKMLLTSVRWEYKNPWEIRRSQNWIGWSNLSNAFFVPPHHEDLDILTTDLEKFIHNDALQIPELIKVALAHYQFETIHPYLDGNGRIGRLIIILYLIEKKILSRPILYISDFFERNKWSYYDALTMARSSNNIEHFILFFLTGIIETCQSSLRTFQSIIQMKKEIEEKILWFGARAERAHTLLVHLFSHPIISISDIANLLGVTHTTANTLIQIFKDIWVLHEITGFKKHKIYIFEDYIKLFR